MTFRTKLLLVTSATVAGAVALVTGAVSVASRSAFERVDAQRRSALLEQFEKEIKLQGAAVQAAVRRAAESSTITRLAAAAARPDPDFAAFYTDAERLAESTGLTFLDITRKDLTILSSAHWPVRFGYRNDWASCAGCKPGQPFLTKVPLPDGSSAVALAATVQDADLLLVGGRRLDSTFLKALGEAPGVRALLCLGPQECFAADGSTRLTRELQALVGEAQTGNRVARRLADEAFVAVPQRGEGGTLAVLLVGSSLVQQSQLERSILLIGLWVAAGGILLGVLLGWWTTERVTRPVNELARGARAVAAGNWSTKVNVPPGDEMGELAAAFNAMTGQLIEQQDRALQAERVAAWRELARRLAHELKNPLFPLQITVENMQRARGSNQFDEVFHEGTRTLLDEVKNFKTIIGRFSDFARMPAPHFEQCSLPAIIESVLKLYEPQLAEKNIMMRTQLPENPTQMDADPDQLRRAFGNLTLNAIDAMPSGGTLTFALSETDGAARIEISDTGQGLTEEECSRLFTPYYTTKQHGTGLGLAIVQGVVSDHHGKISVVSNKGEGAAFIIELPLRQVQTEQL